jgi:Fe-S-cluster-containing hydrogenase component 2
MGPSVTANREHQGIEKLRLRPGDAELTLPQILGISLFKDLSPRAHSRLRGKGGQGAVVLRRYQAGEVICRQGAPGWTAFYLIEIDDLLRLRESQHTAALAADRKLSQSLPETLAMSMEERLQRADAIEAHTGGGADTVALLRASASRPFPTELTALREERALLRDEERIERLLAHSHPELLLLDPAAKRRHADMLPVEAGELAGRLRLLADCAASREKVAVFRELKSTTPVGLLARLTARLSRPRLDHRSEDREGSAARRSEGGPSLPASRIATLYEGELFGEMSCIYRTPRSATVRALRDCYALEFLSLVLDILLTSEHFRAYMDSVYRNRMLSQHLRAIPFLANAPSVVIDVLRQNAQLITKQPGELLFEQGDPSDCLFIVRTGRLKLFHRASGRLIAHRARGEAVGDLGLLTARPRDASCAAYQPPAVEHRTPGRELPALRCEAVRIDRELLDQACQGAPLFREELARLRQENSGVQAANNVSSAQNTSRIEDLDLLQGRNLMLIDLTRCTWCGDCVSACTEVSSDGKPHLSLQGPRFGRYLIPTTCRVCADPVCLIGCPVGAIHQGSTGQIVIEDWCIGCGLCAAQCPYGAIEQRGSAQLRAEVCDQCASQPSGPQCVSSCRHEAAIRVDAKDFFPHIRVM